MPDRDPGVITSHSGLSFQTSRPLWISQDKVCVLATETTDQGQYNLQYTLPDLNSPEKCITDNTTQPRNAEAATAKDTKAMAGSFKWQNGQFCTFVSDENELGYIIFYYGVDIGTAASLGFLLATMMAGFGIAGICHRFLVRPAHMIWPSVLLQITLIQSFHKEAEDNTDRGSSRLRFFAVAVVAVVVYQFVPGYLAPLLSSIGIICLLTSNPIAQHIGSPNKGVGVLSFSLDWSIIGALGNPLTVPFWVQYNVFMSWIIFAWVLTPLAWRGQWFGGPTLGIVLNTSELVNKTGDVVGARQLVDPVTNDLLLDVYNAQAPFYMSPFFAFTHCAAFAAFPAAISQALVWHGRDLFRRFRSASLQEDEDDIHCQLIDRYPAVPWTWYALFFVVPAALGIVVCHTSGIDMPWYLSLLSLAVSVCGSIPYGILYAVTGIQLSLKVMSEFLIGVISPGHPILVMAFRTLAVTVALAVTKLLEDLKVGHYMKVPPRHVFLAQMYAQVLAVLVAYATLDGWTRDPQHVDWVVHPERYTHDPIAAQWKSSGAFFMAYNISLIWGAIGPVRFFITSYLPLVCIGFAIGGLIPVLCKLGDMYFPTRFPWRLVSAPLLLCLYGPGISTAIPMTSILITFASQYWAFRYRRAWWKRYNYVLATALDIGAVVSTILIVYTIHAHQVRGPTWALDGQSGDFCTQVKTDKALASQ
ncbi:OPT superfamily [Sorochytrium milnesiophthora]